MCVFKCSKEIDIISTNGRLQCIQNQQPIKSTTQHNSYWEYSLPPVIRDFVISSFYYSQLALLVNFTNTLRAAFAPEFFQQIVSKPNCNLRKAVKTLLHLKAARKMLIKRHLVNKTECPRTSSNIGHMYICTLSVFLIIRGKFWNRTHTNTE